jgi:signal transduction histidine kinase
LHDNIGQLLTLAKIQLQNATKENIDEVSETITKGLNEVRALSKLINPEAINKIELKEAIQLEIDRFNRLNFIDSALEVFGNEKEIDKKSSIIIFRILQEFFSNTIKHSRASKLVVTLEYTNSHLMITAKDNGVGFSSKEKKEGIGLINIKHRAKLIGAEIQFISEKNKGTTLHINYKL